MPARVSPDQVLAQAAGQYRGAGFDDSRVALLLAAGNVPSLTVTDLLHLLFQQGCVVAVKMNPVLAYLRPTMERLFADFNGQGDGSGSSTRQRTPVPTWRTTLASTGCT